MKFTDFLSVLSGLAIFLYGMEIMGSGFKHMAGGKLQDTLEKLTKKPIVGLLAGLVITVLVQSSGATTSMLVSFVDAGIMRVAQTVFVIMGSNIGTTLTGHLMALDVGLVSPFLAFVGVCLIMFIKNDKANAIGEIMMGLGFVFIGMDMMSSGLSPLRSSAFFIDLIVKLQNPALGILVGFVFTTMVQSSTASLGIIQSLAKGGLVQIKDVMFFNLGQKIGSCTTAMLTALSFNRDAKRVSLINLGFNVLGAIIFTILYLLLPFEKLYAMLAPGNVVEQIAMMHSFVSIVEAIIFFPIADILPRIAYLIIPDQGSEKKLQNEVTPADKNIANAAFNIYGINVELSNMLDIVETCIQKSLVAILEHHSVVEEVDEKEDQVNEICNGISKNLSALMAANINRKETHQASQFFRMNIDLERMNDHALNLAEAGEFLHAKDKSLPIENYDGIRELSRVLFDSLDLINRRLGGEEMDIMPAVSSNEDRIDDLCIRYRDMEIERMKASDADVETGITFTELLIDIERIGDHIVNIAECISEKDDEAIE